jgi:hypothetical protein
MTDEMVFWEMPLQDESNRMAENEYQDYKDALNKNKTEVLKSRLKVIASSQQNFIMSCFAPQGYGKSYAMIFLAEMYSKFAGIPLSIRNVCFTVTDMLRAVEDGQKGDLFILDEQIHTHGYGSNVEKNMLVNIERVVRAHKLCFFFIAPEWIPHTYHYYIETYQMGGDSRFDPAKPLEEQWKYTKSILYDNRNAKLGYIITGEPQNKEFLALYNAKKDEFVSTVRSMGGGARDNFVTDTARELVLSDKAISLFDLTVPMTFREMYKGCKNKMQKLSVINGFIYKLLKGRIFSTTELNLLVARIDMMTFADKLGKRQADSE